MDDGKGFWRLSDPKLEKHVLIRIKKEGALMSKDFKKEKKRPDEPWRIPVINAVIQQLFMKGEIMIAKRRGILKYYDLPERVVPENISTNEPIKGAYLEYLIRRDLKAHGLVKLNEFGYLLRIPKKEFLTVIKRMIKNGEVEEVQINGLENNYYSFKNAVDEFEPTSKNNSIFCHHSII